MVTLVTARGDELVDGEPQGKIFLSGTGGGTGKGGKKGRLYSFKGGRDKRLRARQNNGHGTGFPQKIKRVIEGRCKWEET